MKFRTEIEEERAERRVTLSPGRPVVMVGSCFADNMVRRLQECLWDASRPHGTLYNPVSIEMALRLTLLEDEETAVSGFRKSLLNRDGLVLSWMFDSKMAGTSESELIDRFLELRRQVEEKFSRGTVLFVTLGTAWCYRLDAEGEEMDGEIVANCHKMPASMFLRRRLAVDEIVNEWRTLVRELRERYPGLPVVFTVSPVRHIKDTLHGNQLSKSTLLLSVNELCSSLPDCHYFPAYEMMMDDLRDYRFYASDLVHPGEQGVEYIWEKFKAGFMDAAGLEALKAGEKEYKRAHHRPNINI